MVLAAIRLVGLPEIIGKGVRFPHCPATVNGDENRNDATEFIGKAR